MSTDPADLPYTFVPVEELKVGDITAGAEVLALRETAKRIYITIPSSSEGGGTFEFPQPKGTRISKLEKP